MYRYIYTMTIFVLVEHLRVVPISIHSIIPTMLYGTHTIEVLCGHAMEEEGHVCHIIRNKSKSSSVCWLSG